MRNPVSEQATRRPDRTAIVYNDTALTYAALNLRIDCARRFLAGQGLGRRGAVALCLPNTLDAWVTALALRSLGRISVAIAAPGEAPLLALSEIAGLVVSDDEPLTGLAADNSLRVIRTPRSVLCGESDSTPLSGFPETLAGGHLMLSSGTTGTIKKVLINAGSEPGHVRQRTLCMDLDADTVINIFDWALWSSVGYIIPITVWELGGTVVIRQPARHPGARGHRRMTHAITTPMMLASILADPEQGPWPGAPRLFVTGSALSLNQAAETLRRLTPNLIQSVGSTEAGMWCRTPIIQPRDVASHRPTPGRVVQVVDESGTVLPAGQTGLVRVDSLPGARSYHEDEAATQTWFRDGFFYSGDLGVFDADGRLTIQGRMSDVVVVGGEKRAAEAFEAIVQRRLGETGVAVFSTPGEGLTEELHVVFEGGTIPPVEDLKALAADELAAFPKVHFHALETLTRSDRGKLRRFIVKQRILAGWKPPAATTTQNP